MFSAAGNDMNFPYMVEQAAKKTLNWQNKPGLCSINDVWRTFKTLFAPIALDDFKKRLLAAFDRSQVELVKDDGKTGTLHPADAAATIVDRGVRFPFIKKA